MLSFNDPCGTEIDYRVACAWKKIMLFKHALNDRRISLNQRLLLFEATASATMLYGNAAWALTKKLELKVHRPQRRM